MGAIAAMSSTGEGKGNPILDAIPIEIESRKVGSLLGAMPSLILSGEGER